MIDGGTTGQLVRNEMGHKLTYRRKSAKERMTTSLEVVKKPGKKGTSKGEKRETLQGLQKHHSQ